MHGVPELFGYGIALSFGTALLAGAVGRWAPVRTAMMVVAGLFVGTLILLTTTGVPVIPDLAVLLPLLGLAAVVGLIGALPGAALGTWIRTNYIRGGQ